MSVAALEALVARFPEAIAAHGTHRGDEWAAVRREHVRAVCLWLRDDPATRFEVLMDLTAVDYLGYEGPREPERPAVGAERFEVVYHLYSLATKKRLRLKVRLFDDACEVDTVVPVWASANWFEREVWDLYGVRFLGHPDLRRLLLYEEFQGHPLRKDYRKDKQQPLVGPVNIPARPFTGGRDLISGPPLAARGIPAETPPGAAIRLGDKTELR